MGDVQIAILCPRADHAVNSWLEMWAERQRNAVIVRDADKLPGGDFLFLISCDVIVSREVRDKYRHVLVIHASDLPADRGFSPYLWTILEGGSEVVVTLLTAEDRVDSGDIWRQERFPLDGSETFEEIMDRLFAVELDLMDWALANCDSAEPRKQIGEPNYRRRRTAADSEVQVDQTLAEIFDLLRVSDPNRLPAFFNHRGARYEIGIHKVA